MKRTIRAVIAATVMATISFAHGFSLPNVGTDVVPNQWTSNMSGVLAAAQSTGYPIFLVMLNSTSTGGGCSHCHAFVEKTLNVPEFDAIVRDYKFYLVLLNLGGAVGTTSPGGVSVDVFDNYFRRYASSDVYPCVAVIRPDGSRYKGWGYSTNPSTESPILHQYIRAAIAEIAVPGATGSEPATASTPAAASTPATGTGTGSTATRVPRTYTRATYACFRFSDAGDIEACAVVRLTTSGRWSARFTEGGATTSLRGNLTSSNGGYTIASGNTLNITFDAASGIWSGTSYGRKVYGTAVTKADAQWKGTWNSGVRTSASATLGGWVAARVANSGQVTFTGSIANRFRISGRGYSAVFPASFVAGYLPRWAGHGDVRFVCMGRVNGGYALCADGKLGGKFNFNSVTYDRVDGSKWSGGSIAALNGAAFKTTGGGNVVIPVTVNAEKMSAGQNDIRARISATTRSGRVRASYTSGGSGKASGLLYFANGRLTAVGGGSVGQEPFAFVIE